MANVTVNGEPVVTEETAKHYRATIQFNRETLSGRIVKLQREGESFFRVQIDGNLWNALRATDSRKSPRIGILFDDGFTVTPMYLQAWASPDSEITKQMAIFGKLTPTTAYSRELPTAYYYVTPVSAVLAD